MSDDGVIYYRSGIVDNTYDVQKKKVKSDEDHLSCSVNGGIKFALDFFFKLFGKHYFYLPATSTCITKSPSRGTLIQESDDRMLVCYADSVIGYLADDVEGGQRRYSFDIGAYEYLCLVQRSANSEKDRKELERWQSGKINKMYNRCTIYKMDENRRCGVEDFLMTEVIRDQDEYNEKEDKVSHFRHWLQVYTINRASVDKKELKELKKKNRVKMTYEALQQLERQHNIPALPDHVTRAVEALQK